MSVSIGESLWLLIAVILVGALGVTIIYATRQCGSRQPAGRRSRSREGSP
ncbi:MAG: hypothetical protein JO230_27815 [Xanthobacteraceae bacterium]|nr:hypothetical protein [Xanthobacteraceae bacterium]